MSPSLVRGVVVLLTWKAPSKRLVGPNLLLCWKKDISQTILYYYSKNLPPCYLGRPLTTMRDMAMAAAILPVGQYHWLIAAKGSNKNNPSNRASIQSCARCLPFLCNRQVLFALITMPCGWETSGDDASNRSLCFRTSSTCFSNSFTRFSAASKLSVVGASIFRWLWA